MEPESSFATAATPRPPLPSAGLERPRPAPVSAELVGREVSCRVLGAFFDAARERGLPPEALIEGNEDPEYVPGRPSAPGFRR